jgi:hypothetical protein
VDGYLADRAASLFAPVIDYLSDAGEARSGQDLEHHFKKAFDVSGVPIACEYLADRGLIGRAAMPVRLTKRSNLQVQELAFYALTR